MQFSEQKNTIFQLILKEFCEHYNAWLVPLLKPSLAFTCATGKIAANYHANQRTRHVFLFPLICLNSTVYLSTFSYQKRLSKHTLLLSLVMI